MISAKNYLVESATMATEQEGERIHIEKDIVKEALREILNEILSFPAMVQGSRTGGTAQNGDDPPTDPPSNGDDRQPEKDKSSKI